MKKCISEFIGTAVLVLMGCGTAVISGGNIIATSFAFGLAIVTMAYAIGNISGCHVNPAVSLAMLINKKMSFKDFICYVISQILGAFAGTGILYFILKSIPVVKEITLGANGYESASMVNLNLAGAIVVEIILTFIFVYCVLGVTQDKSKSSVAGIVVGLALTFVHILGIGLTGTSVNPARSLAPAVVMGGDAVKQVWVFIVAPFAGAIIAAITYKFLNKEKYDCKCECCCGSDSEESCDCGCQDGEPCTCECNKEECKEDKKETNQDVKEDVKEVEQSEDKE